MELTSAQEWAVETGMKDCFEALSRLAVLMDGQPGGDVAQVITAATAMAAGQSLTRVLTAARVPDELQPALVEHFAETLKAQLLAYVDSPLYWRHRTGSPTKPSGAPALRKEPPIFRVEGGWHFQPSHMHAPSDGVAYHPDKPKKGRHDAFCLGGVVICEAWKRPRRLLGPWEAKRRE
jgi:hypothetical protein